MVFSLFALKAMCFAPDEKAGGGSGSDKTADAPVQEGQDKGTPDPKSGEGKSYQEGQVPDWVKDPVKAYEEIQKVRREAQENREAREKLESERRQQDEARQKAEQDNLKEQGHFKELWEKNEPELTRLKAEEAMFKKYKEAFQQQYENRMKTVPPHIKDLLAKMDALEAMAWLDANADKVNPPQAPDLDAGKKSDKKDATYLGTPEHIAEAAKRLRLPIPTSREKK